MSEPQRFRKKPVEIEAMQFGGGLSASQAHEIYRWIEKNTLGSFDVNELWSDPKSFTWPASGVSIDARDGRMVIATLEGGHWVDLDDWIIRGVAGEFYPCRADIFAATYEAVASDERAEICAVLEEAREWQGRTRAFRSPLENMVSRLIDALAEARAEVERLRQAVDDATHFYHQALEERDAALAVIERVRALTDDHRNTVRNSNIPLPARVLYVPGEPDEDGAQ